jgi:hypothetical protein
MNRLGLFLVLSVVVPAAMAQDTDMFSLVEVTGTIQLPAGATLPAKVRIDVEIGKIDKGQVLTFFSRSLAGRKSPGSPRRRFSSGCSARSRT